MAQPLPTEPAIPATGLAPFLDAMTTMAAFRALRELGVLDLLAGGAADVDRIVDELRLARRALVLGLEVLAAAGVVEAVDSGWRLAAEPTALDRFEAALDLIPALRGQPPTADASRVGCAEALYPAVVDALAALAAPVEGAVVPALLASPVRTVVEVAAGASPWGRALCRADESVTVTALDLPAVLDRTRRAVADAGLGHRYTFVAGDVLDVADVAPADLVVVAGLCRLLPAEDNRRLFSRTARWCRPGGRIAVIDAVATARARAAGLARYELGLAARTSGGRCWTLEHYARWLVDAGFTGIDLTPTPRPEVTVVTADRRKDLP